MDGEGLPAVRIKRGTSPLFAESGENTIEEDFADDQPYALVPLPTEIPPPPNLASLPARILHSGTVETLIGQNEDLMARLKVNLRRNAILEQQILELEKDLAELRQANTTLKDQVAIVNEKDRVWKEKTGKIEARFDDLQDEIVLLQTKLTESTSASRQKIRVLESFMRRTKRWLKPGAKKLRSQLSDERRRATDMVMHLSQQNRDLAARDAQIGELRAKVEELVTHLHCRERNWQADQARLVDSYESRLTDMIALNEKLETDLKYFKERARHLDDVTSRQVEAENRAILFQRKCAEAEKKINTDVLELQTQTATYRGEAKALAAELEALREETLRMRNDSQVLEDENERLRDQLDSLQAIWHEGRNQTESLELRLDAMNKINQELSRKLKDERVERENQALTLKAAPSPSTPHAAFDKLQKIDSLLATIESGFPMSKAPEVHKAHGLDIIEGEKSRT